jgi:hypothetical protein
MNPLEWKWQHLVTWAVLIFAGAAAGMVFGWLISPFSHLQGADTRTMFFAWLHYPWTYWPYVAVGAITAGLAYYSADLLTGAR